MQQAFGDSRAPKTVPRQIKLLLSLLTMRYMLLFMLARSTYASCMWLCFACAMVDILLLTVKTKSISGVKTSDPYNALGVRIIFGSPIALIFSLCGDLPLSLLGCCVKIQKVSTTSYPSNYYLPCREVKHGLPLIVYRRQN